MREEGLLRRITDFLRKVLQTTRGNIVLKPKYINLIDRDPAHGNTETRQQ
jgi:hypothetical protein